MTEITAEQRIAFIKHEISERERIYPKLVASGKMKDHEAFTEIALLQSVLETLRIHGACGNYVTDHAARPTKITFMNGTIIQILRAYDNDLGYLEVTRHG